MSNPLALNGSSSCQIHICKVANVKPCHKWCCLVPAWAHAALCLALLHTRIHTYMHTEIGYRLLLCVPLHFLQDVELSVELPLADIIRCAAQMGFSMQQQNIVDAPYLGETPAHAIFWLWLGLQAVLLSEHYLLRCAACAV